jgi:23S rRNA G2445 N2-methylase RlmL
VPASSHPTIAAALVRIASGPIGRHAQHDPGEVVWDPFVGSGGELCERALAGPFRLLVGSDRDQAALSIARENLAAAGAGEVKLFCGNALDFRPPTARPSLILTNPPMGRRILRGADLGAFLERFLGHAAGVLAPEGRIVWVSPLPRRTALCAERLGLSVLYRQEVDMGGFAAEIQVLRKDAAGAARGEGAAPSTRPVAR